VNRIGKIENRDILLLQGPMGDFFRRLDTLFRKRGARTYRIGLNAGDRIFSHADNYIAYRGRPEEWEEFLRDFLEKRSIDKIFLFGDCRFYQGVAVALAKELNIDLFVFELGYVRPDYVTMERYGVNDYSLVSRDPSFYREMELIVNPEPIPARPSRFKMLYSAVLYYFVANLFSFRYPYYRHHRDFSALREAFYGFRGALRKLIYPFFENRYMPLLKGKYSKRYYLVPLQTHNDFQVLQHSDYLSIEKFIIEVIESFSKNADDESFLLFKHHPVDRGRKNYREFITRQAEIYGVSERIFVVHDLYLPTLLEHSRAVVTINSTVGLTALGFGIPTITLGNAIYDIEGLTCRAMKLDDFWNSYEEPDGALYEKYVNYLIDKTQLNGSFYGLFPVELESEEMYEENDSL
jgi:capsular polysaccharide export protein